MVVRRLLPALLAAAALTVPFATAAVQVPVVLGVSGSGRTYTLSWTAPAVGDADSYLVTRTLDGRIDTPVSVSGLSYQDTPPAGVVVVTYQVQWVDHTGAKSPTSNPVAVSTWPSCPWIGINTDVPPDHIPPIAYFDPECLLPA